MDFFVKYLKNSEINRERWDECVFRAYNTHSYAFSWYLDAVCESWDALIIDDYQAVFPIPFKKRYGLYIIYQPFLIQQLGIFSLHPLSSENQTRILQSIPKKFKIGRLQLNSFNNVDKQLFKTIENVNYELKLDFDYQHLFANYSENAKRNLKKAHKANVQIREGESLIPTVEMFRMHKMPTLKNVPEALFNVLAELFGVLKEKNCVSVYEAFTDKNELCASVILMETTQRLVYLFSGCTPLAYQNGAQFFLVDFIINKFSKTFLLLDFEGSNDPNLARFYKGFGSERKTYPVIFFENFPKPVVKILQKMRKI